MSKLVLVRHGESRWNLSGRFTGWVDVPLSKNGVQEAADCAKRLNGTNFDVAFTSNLERAHATLILILSEQDRTGVFQHEGEKSFYEWTCDSNRCSIDDIPIYKSELLNERYYGDLQGMMKEEAVKKYGKEQVLRWRRGFRDAPPKGESLEEAYERVLPYYNERIERALKEEKNVLLVGHGNTLRAIIKHLEHISDEEIPFLDLPEGTPIFYTFAEGECTCQNPESLTFNRPLR